jgi:tetratricopeptide (TPR) repeat protein
MICLRSGNHELMERYLNQDLPEGEAEEFEAHVLECADCAEALERLATLRAELERRREEIEAAPRRAPSSGSWMPWLGLAAVAVVAAGLLFLMRGESRQSMAPLASIEAPIYVESQLRGTADEAEERFRTAMELYQEADFRGALTELEAAAELDSERIELQFFLGACRLLTGDVDGAIKDLNRVIELGDTPFLEEALFLRAQGHLVQENPAAAAADLRSILELDGDWVSRAQDQLEQLEAWSAVHG